MKFDPSITVYCECRNNISLLSPAPSFMKRIVSQPRPSMGCCRQVCGHKSRLSDGLRFFFQLCTTGWGPRLSWGSRVWPNSRCSLLALPTSGYVTRGFGRPNLFQYLTLRYHVINSCTALACSLARHRCQVVRLSPHISDLICVHQAHSLAS